MGGGGSKKEEPKEQPLDDHHSQVSNDVTQTSSGFHVFELHLGSLSRGGAALLGLLFVLAIAACCWYTICVRGHKNKCLPYSWRAWCGKGKPKKGPDVEIQMDELQTRLEQDRERIGTKIKEMEEQITSQSSRRSPGPGPTEVPTTMVDLTSAWSSLPPFSSSCAGTPFSTPPSAPQVIHSWSPQAMQSWTDWMTTCSRRATQARARAAHRGESRTPPRSSSERIHSIYLSGNASTGDDMLSPNLTCPQQNAKSLWREMPPINPTPEEFIAAEAMRREERAARRLRLYAKKSQGSVMRPPPSYEVNHRLNERLERLDLDVATIEKELEREDTFHQLNRRLQERRQARAAALGATASAFVDVSDCDDDDDDNDNRFEELDRQEVNPHPPAPAGGKAEPGRQVLLSRENFEHHGARPRTRTAMPPGFANFYPPSTDNAHRGKSRSRRSSWSEADREEARKKQAEDERCRPQ